jgi:hypothetical protein
MKMFIVNLFLVVSLIIAGCGPSTKTVKIRYANGTEQTLTCEHLVTHPKDNGILVVCDGNKYIVSSVESVK